MSFLGIDLGTGSLKLAIVDGTGRETAAASVAYAIETPHPGWAETSVDTWWRALCEAAARLPAQQRDSVEAVGFSGQMHGVVLTDAEGRAIRPAMLWPDTRALGLLGEWPEPQPNPVAPGMAGPLLRWIVQHEPQSAHAARWALQPKDWLRVALGGAVQTDPSDACATALADPAGVWDRAQLERLELPETWFAPLAPSYAVGGILSQVAASALGLRAGIVLANGGADTPCARQRPRRARRRAAHDRHRRPDRRARERGAGGRARAASLSCGERSLVPDGGYAERRRRARNRPWLVIL
jgi:xylulokinase